MKKVLLGIFVGILAQCYLGLRFLSWLLDKPEVVAGLKSTLVDGVEVGIKRLVYGDSPKYSRDPRSRIQYSAPAPNRPRGYQMQ